MKGSLDAAAAIAADTDALMARMPWVAQAERTATVQVVDGVRRAVEAGRAPEEVSAAVARADQAVRARPARRPRADAARTALDRRETSACRPPKPVPAVPPCGEQPLACVRSP